MLVPCKGPNVGKYYQSHGSYGIEHLNVLFFDKICALIRMVSIFSTKQDSFYSGLGS